MLRAARAAAALALWVCLAAPAAAAEQPLQEALGVEGAGTPTEAPRVEPGLYLDLIREPETLWYAIPAQAGQRVAAQVVARGRPEGPTARTSQLTAELTDGQRQASGEAVSVTFTGTADARVDVIGEPLPVTGEDVAYLAVTLADPSGGNDLRDVGYQLDFSVAVSGSPVSEEPTPADGDPAVAVVPTVEPAERQATAPAATRVSAADFVPTMLVGFALGGVLGFEGMRSRLRRSR